MKDIKIIFAVGFLGGLVLAVYEVTIFLVKTKAQFFLLPDFFYHALLLVIIYSLLGSLGMILFGGFASLSVKAGGYQLDKSKFIALQAGLAALLIISPIIADPFDVFSIDVSLELAVVTGQIFFLSLFSAVGVGGLTYFLVTHYSPKKIFSWIGVILLTLFIMWSFWIAQDSQSNLISKDFSVNSDMPTSLSRSLPNILWIVMDTARADHFSSYGYHRNTTPNIDSISKEGALYKNAFSVAAWTNPSHASMFTGLYPSGHGLNMGWNWLGDNFTTIAEILGEQGYYTAGFSNNSGVSKINNNAQGFDTFILQDMVDGGNLRMETSLLARVIKKFQGTFNFKDIILTTFYNLIAPEFSLNYTDAGEETTNELVKTYIEKIRTNNNPFFVFINYITPHEPYGDTPWRGKYLEELGVDLSRAEAYRSPDVYKHLAGEAKLDDEGIEILNALYDSDLSYLDQKIGELMEYFRGLGILDNTLVVITSDHGENLGEHGKVSHIFDIHKTLTHVPLVIRYPKLFQPGTIKEEPVQTIDIYPTILDILDIRYDKSSIDGRSFFDADRMQITISESRFDSDIQKVLDLYPNYYNRLNGGMFKSIRFGDYEYIIEGSGKEYLYNVKRDPKELFDLVDSKKEKTKELKNLLIQMSRKIKKYWEPR